MTRGAVQPWWQQPGALPRFVRDVLLAEMAQLRPGGWALPAAGWHGGLHLADDLGADSLELMALSTALSDACGLTDPDDAQRLYDEPTVAGWQAIAQRALAARPHQMRFRTSGSTGTPRSCVHRLDGLTEEMQAMAAAIGPVGRVVSLVRCHHIYGFLFTLLLPRLLQPRDAAHGIEVIDLYGMPPAAVPARLREGDLLVGVPVQWQALARLAPRWPAQVIGTTSTAPCPAEVCDTLRHSGLHRLLHVYGSSETSGIGWREGGEPSYRLHPYWHRVDGDPQTLVRTLPLGTALRAELQDRIDWPEQRRFVPGPRIDGAVQVGGVNVHLAAVRETLMRHPNIAQVALRLHPFEAGPRLKAFVVPRIETGLDCGSTAEQDFAASLHDWSRRHLAPPARPVHWRFGETLPVNEAGKACDWRVEG